MGWWYPLAMVYVFHLNGDTEGLGQHDNVDVVTSHAHGLHFLMVELLDSQSTLDDVVEECTVMLKVV